MTAEKLRSTSRRAPRGQGDAVQAVRRRGASESPSRLRRQTLAVAAGSGAPREEERRRAAPSPAPDAERAKALRERPAAAASEALAAPPLAPKTKAPLRPLAAGVGAASKAKAEAPNAETQDAQPELELLELPGKAPRESLLEAADRVQGAEANESSAGPPAAGRPDSGPLKAAPLDAAPLEAAPPEAAPRKAAPLELADERQNSVGLGADAVPEAEAEPERDGSPVKLLELELEPAAARPPELARTRGASEAATGITPPMGGGTGVSCRPSTQGRKVVECAYSASGGKSSKSASSSATDAAPNVSSSQPRSSSRGRA
jgi:hypothetical protein